MSRSRSFRNANSPGSGKGMRVVCQPLPFQHLLRGALAWGHAGIPHASSLLYHPMLGPGELKKQNNLLFLYINCQIDVQSGGFCCTPLTPAFLPGTAQPFEVSPGSSCPPGALLTPAGAGSARAPAHPATGTSTIELGVHNLITCCVRKYFPPSVQYFCPIISLDVLYSILQLSSVFGKRCQAFAVCKLLGRGCGAWPAGFWIS